MVFDTCFLRACRREKVDFTPIWLMRQAGRYLPEYRKIRQKMSFLAMCKTPEIAAKVTILPVEKLNVDAAILFADLLLPLEVSGIKFEISENEGVVIINPLRKINEVKSLKIDEVEEKLSFVVETIKIVIQELQGEVPLIGFAGAPFTLASYIIEGGHSSNYLKTKSLMYREPKVWYLLMDKLVHLVIKYLKMQIETGVQAIQIFDSWISCLNPSDYVQYVLPYSKKIFTSLKKFNIPLIHFATGSAGLLELMKNAGGNIRGDYLRGDYLIGIDWRIDLDDAWKRIGYDVGIQGNLDPAALFAPKEKIRERVKDILKRAGNRPGHIFNLGHGVLPNTPVENVIALVEFVHDLSRR